MLLLPGSLLLMPPSPAARPFLTVIIFDWDNTIMPTDFVVLNFDKSEKFIGPFKVPPKQRQQLEKLEDAALKCFAEASKLGEVIILTNGLGNWPEYSAKLFMPKLLPLLQNTTVVSARDDYESLYPEDYTRWKVEKFRDELSRIWKMSPSLFCYPINPELQIVSVGDGEAERIAVKYAGARLGATPKSIKLYTRPPVELLVDELNTVTNWIRSVVEDSGEVDMVLVAPNGFKELPRLHDSKPTFFSSCAQAITKLSASLVQAATSYVSPRKTQITPVSSGE